MRVADNDADNRAGEMRWQAERKAAMETSVAYWAAKIASSEDANCNKLTESVQGNIVWAGLEPLEFISIFPKWQKREDVAKTNIQVAKCV